MFSLKVFSSKFKTISVAILPGKAVNSVMFMTFGFFGFIRVCVIKC